jgi:hypothetical protein
LRETGPAGLAEEVFPMTRFKAALMFINGIVLCGIATFFFVAGALPPFVDLGISVLGMIFAGLGFVFVYPLKR